MEGVNKSISSSSAPGVLWKRKRERPFQRQIEGSCFIYLCPYVYLISAFSARNLLKAFSFCGVTKAGILCSVWVGWNAIIQLWAEVVCFCYFIWHLPLELMKEKPYEWADVLICNFRKAIRVYESAWILFNVAWVKWCWISFLNWVPGSRTMRLQHDVEIVQ